MAADLEGLSLHDRDRRRAFALAAYASAASMGSAGSNGSTGALLQRGGGSGLLFADAATAHGSVGGSAGSAVYPHPQLRQYSATGLLSSQATGGGGGGDGGGGGGLNRVGSFVNPFAAAEMGGGGGRVGSLGHFGGSSLLRSGSAASLLAGVAGGAGGGGQGEGRSGREEDKLVALATGVLAYTSGCLASAAKAAASAATSSATAAPTPHAALPTEADLNDLVRRLLVRSPFLRDLAEEGAAWVERRTGEVRRRLALLSLATFDVDRRAPTLEGDARCKALGEWLAASSEPVAAAVIAALDLCDLDRAQSLAAKVHLAVASHLAGMRVPVEEAGARRLQQGWRTAVARQAARKRALRVYARVAAPDFGSEYVFNRRLGSSHWMVPWYAERLGVRMDSLPALGEGGKRGEGEDGGSTAAASTRSVVTLTAAEDAASARSVGRVAAAAVAATAGDGLAIGATTHTTSSSSLLPQPLPPLSTET